MATAVTGTVTLDGITSSSNTMTDTQMREELGVTEPQAPAEPTPDPAPEPIEPEPDPAPVETKPDAKPAVKAKKYDPTKDPEVRIGKATAERERAREEAARERGQREKLEQELAALKAQYTAKSPEKTVEKPSADMEPTLEQFQDQPDPYASYLRAMARYDLKQELAQREQQALEARSRYQQEQTAKQREQAEQTRIATFGTKLQQALLANPDLEAQMASTDIQITRPMADAIIESDAPHALIAHLLGNPALVDEIAALDSPLKQFRALARLDAQLEPATTDTGSVVSKKTAAQPPIRPVSGSHSAPAGGAPDPATCTQEEWDTYYNAQEKASRARGRR